MGMIHLNKENNEKIKKITFKFLQPIKLDKNKNERPKPNQYQRLEI